MPFEANNTMIYIRNITIRTAKSAPYLGNVGYNGFHIAYFKARDAAGLPEVRIHDLRHTYASLLINNGVSLYEVQELLGHSSSAMTQRYAHLQPNQLRSRTEIVGRIVDGGL